MTTKGHGQQRGQRRGALDGGNLWWIAPTFPVSSEIWRDLKRACRDAWITKNEVERSIDLPGGGRITVKSADNPDGLRGAGLDGVVLDEAASIKAEVWKQAVRPALSDKQGWAVFIGTPKGFNWFHDLYRDAEHLPDWSRWQRPSSDNPLLTAAELADARREIGSFAFAQEYDAQFTADGSGLFQRAWLPIVERLPCGKLRGVRYWDKAATEGDGDYSAGVLMVECEGVYYVAHVARGQWSCWHRDQVIEQCAESDVASIGKVQLWSEQEPGSGGKESAQQMLRRLSRFDVHAERVTGDKETRARPFAAQCEAGNVRLVRGAWNQEFIDELCAFPQGRTHDDQVDAASGAYSKLQRQKTFSVGVA